MGRGCIFHSVHGVLSTGRGSGRDGGEGGDGTCREGQRRTKRMAWWQFAEDADLGNILVRRLCQEAASQKPSGGSSE